MNEPAYFQHQELPKYYREAIDSELARDPNTKFAVFTLEEWDIMARFTAVYDRIKKPEPEPESVFQKTLNVFKIKRSSPVLHESKRAEKKEVLEHILSVVSTTHPSTVAPYGPVLPDKLVLMATAAAKEEELGIEIRPRKAE